MTTITPLQAIERIIESGEDAWESIISLAQSGENDMAQRRWLLGDLALLVGKQYGKNRLSDFATKAGIARSTMNQYKNMSQFYENDTRVSFPNLSYAHFRAAMRLKDDATLFLSEASANEWTVEHAQIEAQKRAGKPTPPIKLLDAEGCIEQVENGRMVIILEPGIDYLEKLVNQQVQVKLYEVTET